MRARDLPARGTDFAPLHPGYGAPPHRFDQRTSVRDCREGNQAAANTAFLTDCGNAIGRKSFFG
jgi:hypothetical protein